MAVRDEDRGYKALVETVFKFGKPVVHVGILEADGGEDHGGMTVAEVAAIHEFGLGVPERSFLRAWFDENEDRAREAIRRLLVSVIAGKRTKEQALELFGQWAQGEIQARIAAGIPPGLAESTIAKKGSSVPLIDTGQLRSAISYMIDFGNGSTKHGTSEAAVKRHQKAKAEKVAAKAEVRKVAKERKAIRRDLKKRVSRLAKKVRKAVVGKRR